MKKLCSFLLLAVAVSGCQQNDNPANVDSIEHKLSENGTPHANKMDSSGRLSAVESAHGTPPEESKAMVINFKAIPTCDEMRSRVAQGASVDDIFNAHMPSDLVGDGVDTISISDADMKHLVAFLACSADLYDWDANVPDASIDLFTSARHKKAAFAALNALANGTGKNAETARKFADQMRDYNGGPNG